MELFQVYAGISQFILLYVVVGIGLYHGMCKALLQDIVNDDIEKEEILDTHRKIFWLSVMWPSVIGISVKKLFFEKA